MIRRFVAAIVAASLAVAVVGCGGGGGGGEEAAPPPADTGAAPAEGGAAPSTPAQVDRSLPESATVFEPFPEAAGLPSAVTGRIAAKQPMAILFVDGSQQVTNEVRGALDGAIKSNGGLVDLVVYDIGKYVSIDASGHVALDDSKFSKDKKAAEAILLATALDVTVTPYIVMTDDQGYVVFRHRGPADRAFLEMHMERLTE